MNPPVSEAILSITPYKPGKPLEELAREYGVTDAVKLASNENPLGPSPKAVEAVRKALGNLHRYPDGACHDLVVRLAETLGVSEQEIVVGNGSDDIIAMLTRAFLQPGDEAIIADPTFLMYEIGIRTSGARVVKVPVEGLGIRVDAILDAVGKRCRLIFLCNPNNPTGAVVSDAEFRRLLDGLPSDVLLVVDEAYMEFVRDPHCARSLELRRTTDRAVVTLRTFSKAYGLAGLRVGYGVMPAWVADILHRVRQPFNVNTLAQVAAAAALDDVAFLNDSIRCVHEGIDWMQAEIEAMGLVCHPTQANFFLIDVGRSAEAVFQAMLREGVIVRSMRAYGYPTHIRVNAGTLAENERFIAALRRVIPEVV
ncbi:MAG: histidinol-phosphate transaminase [Thermodesulfobacteriota bacterium]